MYAGIPLTVGIPPKRGEVYHPLCEKLRRYQKQIDEVIDGSRFLSVSEKYNLNDRQIHLLSAWMSN